MKHRTFLAINLPENIRKKLSDYQEKWPELPVRWTKRENLHITLLFIGSVSDQDIPEICLTTREIASRHPVFGLNLTKISYGPPQKMPPRPPKFPEIVTEEKEWEQKFGRPRMIWAAGQESEELGKLQKDLESSLFTFSFKALSESGIRSFAPHITLGRIRQWDFRRIEPEERPEVKEDVSFSFEVSSIEVMESQLKRGGPEYTILESCPLRS